jgi:acetoin utilization protein AcuB
MRQVHIRRFPVLDKSGQLVGIITETDLFKLFLELLGARKKGARLTMLVPDSKGMLAKITDVPKDKLVETLKPFVVQMIDAREV